MHNPELTSDGVLVPVYLETGGDLALAGLTISLETSTPEPLQWIADTRMIIYSLLLIILMLTRPQGLFSWKKKTKPVLSACRPLVQVSVSDQV